MSPKENMLEIFREAGKTSTRVGSAGPFGGGEIPSGGLPAGGGGGGPRGMVFLGSLAVAFILGLAVGRQLAPGSTASAKEPAANERGSTDSWLDETPGQEFDAGRQASSDPDYDPLRDPKNKYTVAVINYGYNTQNTVYAFNTVDHLLERGFEAYEPYRRGDQIQVFVGAAPTKLRLQEVLDEIQTVVGWDGVAGTFSSAYVVQIDNLVDR